MIDLSKQFHPQPKPLRKVKKTTSLPRTGKKTQEWADAREVIKARFKKGGIIKCEIRVNDICWENNALSFAHIDKRRKLSKEDLYRVVLACIPCHDYVEKLPAIEMKKQLLKIIAERQIHI